MTSPLVTVADLAAALASNAPPTLLDVRWRLGGPPGLDDYRRGHTPVRVLDGGLRAWQDAGLSLPADEPSPEPGDFTAHPGGRALLDAAAAAALARAGVLLDARTGERFRGEVEPIDPVAGHIPGARSLPTLDNLDPATGRFLPPDRLRARFPAAGAVPRVQGGAYCASGGD